MYWKQFSQVVILAHPHAPERRLRDIRGIGHHGAALGEYRARLLIDRGALAYSLTVRPSFSRVSRPPFRSSQVFHDVQAGKRVVGIKHGVRVLAAQIVFHILAGQRRAAADHRKLKPLALQILDDVLHLERRLHQQAAQADGIGLVLLRGLDDRRRRAA